MEGNNSIQDLSADSERESYPFLSWCRQENLQQANVMVVGCGALGNEVLKNLALFGVRHLVIIDFDTIEPSNLTRSVLFRKEDAVTHRKKVKVAADRIKEINPSVEVIPISGDISHDVGLGLVRRMNVVIGCVDNRWARFYINRLCMRAGIPWVDGGIDGLEGTARVFIPGKNCYACNLGPEGLKDLSHRLSCVSVIHRNEVAERVATTPIVASIIGAVQTQEAIKLLHPQELAEGKCRSLCGKMFYYEGEYLSSRLVTFNGYDDECPEHETWKPIVTSDLDTKTSVSQTLMQLSSLLDCKEPTICLSDHCFVDYLLRRDTDEKFKTMIPDYGITTCIENHPVLRFLPFHAFYQHEYRTVDKNFPYQTLSLKQLGISEWDILPVETEKGMFYVELADENHRSASLYLSNLK